MNKETRKIIYKKKDKKLGVLSWVSYEKWYDEGYSIDINTFGLKKTSKPKWKYTFYIYSAITGFIKSITTTKYSVGKRKAIKLANKIASNIKEHVLRGYLVPVIAKGEVVEWIRDIKGWGGFYGSPSVKSRKEALELIKRRYK